MQQLLKKKVESEEFDYLTHASTFFDVAAIITIISDIIMCIGNCIAKTSAEGKCTKQLHLGAPDKCISIGQSPSAGRDAFGEA